MEASTIRPADLLWMIAVQRALLEETPQDRSGVVPLPLSRHLARAIFDVNALLKEAIASPRLAGHANGPRVVLDTCDGNLRVQQE